MSAPAASVPQTLDQLGMDRKILEDLTLKLVYLSGDLSLLDLANRMRLPLAIVQELFQRLRKEQLCEVTGTGLVRDVHQVRVNSQGRTRAIELLTLNQYTGPAPVSLSDYVARVQLQSIRNVRIYPKDLNEALAHLVLEKQTTIQLGTAMTSGKSVFLYGPSGAGKSTLAEAASKVFSVDTVWIPYAVEVDGQIITVYDSVIHDAVTESEEPISFERQQIDTRWVLCQRPRVLVGGELTIEMLDLQFDPIAKFYAGPVQMKANNGVLIVDDFGRQRLRPEELLNRWVVPLDRRIDFLTLAGGRKINIPFDLFVVFATNLDPAQLVDAAFLRRIQTKIKLDAITAEQFQEIFQRVCGEFGLTYDAGVAHILIGIIRDELKEPLRACYPRDIVEQICWAAGYQGFQPQISLEAAIQACRNYFLSR